MGTRSGIVPELYLCNKRARFVHVDKNTPVFKRRAESGDFGHFSCLASRAGTIRANLRPRLERMFGFVPGDLALASINPRAAPRGFVRGGFAAT